MSSPLVSSPCISTFVEKFQTSVCSSPFFSNTERQLPLMGKNHPGWVTTQIGHLQLQYFWNCVFEPANKIVRLGGLSAANTDRHSCLLFQACMPGFLIPCYSSLILVVVLFDPHGMVKIGQVQKVINRDKPYCANYPKGLSFCSRVIFQSTLANGRSLTSLQTYTDIEIAHVWLQKWILIIINP